MNKHKTIHLQIMKKPSFFLLLIFFCSWAAAYANGHDSFLKCLSQKHHNYSSISDVVYTKSNSSYTSILNFSIWNLRFTSQSTLKPQLIITPNLESQIPPIIHCAKQTGLEIRTRSGGHDFEGLSYRAQVPFVIIDLINLSEVTVDAEEKTAWVESGAILGSLYYRIAEKSPVLAFPAGGCPTVGVGGHFSGGGHGLMHRKFGLAADHVIDARIVDVNGRILDRMSMGEDLFWAIRGGGGASFGVILAWKVQLVDVPEKVSVFIINRSSEQNATRLVHRWQYVAPAFDKDLFLTAVVRKANRTITASFVSLYLGGVGRFLAVMQESFPELGVSREDCTEMSWIQSVMYFAGFSMESPREVLLNRTQTNVRYLKAKSDYVRTPIPEAGLEGIWRYFDAGEAAEAELEFMPYGGRMAEISESATPFPHRAGNLFELTYLVFWREENGGNSERYVSWVRRLYDYMTPYVTRLPRATYINYRDLDIGVNNINGKTSYQRASVWGKRYFGRNFDHLVRVKTMVDPHNFFRNEQSIPSVVQKGN